MVSASLQSLPRASSDVAPPHYASPEAYLAYLATFSANPTEENDALKVARQFQGHYPDLQQWLAAPLVERIGRRYEEPWAHPSYPQSYRARSYLIFLAASGYMRLDWEWLLATPTFKTQRVYERCLPLLQSFGETRRIERQARPVSAERDRDADLE